MATGLDELLASIAPERTLDVAAARVDAAVNAFAAPGAHIARWSDFATCVGRFLRHVENHLLRLPAGFCPDTGFDQDRALHLLRGIYGPNGEKAAFELARTGQEGGLRAVLRALAARLLEETSRRETRARVAAFWDGLTADAKCAAVREYLGKYGHLIPSELTEGSAARVFGAFTRILEEHPYVLQRLRGAVY